MGVDIHFYTTYGIKIGLDEELNEKLNEFYENGDLPDIIVDETYMVLGPILFDSGGHRWGFEEGDTMEEYSLQDLEATEIEYRLKFKQHLPEFYHLIENKKFKIIAFMYYS